MEEKFQILERFLEANKNKIAKNYDKSQQKLQLLEFNEEGLKQAAQQIKEGNLVAFQTETVYGLGADATNEKALVKIFETKKRPFNDPLIVHVSNVDQALELVQISEQIKKFFLFLSGKFWPGPLTIIMKSNEKLIPNIVTAGTGFVGIRMPKTEVAQQLIKQSNKPIAAPSANLFTHVSPTEAIHVFNDFFDQELSLIIGQNCQFGIESTVIKLLQNEQEPIQILILRKGSVSESQLLNVVQDFPIKVEINCFVKNNQCKQEAPGQMLKHYAPKVPCFMAKINTNFIKSKNKINLEIESCSKLENQSGKEFCSIDKCGIIDFKGVFKDISKELKVYQELSESGDFSQAMNGLYSALRQFENLEGIEIIIISPIQVEGKNQQFMETLLDKVTRASEGKYAFLRDKKIFLQNSQ